MSIKLMLLLLQSALLAFNIWTGLRAMEEGRSGATNLAAAAFMLPLAIYAALVAAQG